MEQQTAFKIITDVFKKSFSSFQSEMIKNEGDWERHLFSLFRDALGSNLFVKYDLYVEVRTKKYDEKNLLWISPKIYNKNIELISEFYDLNFDETQELLIDISKHKKPLDKRIKSFLERQKDKTYKTDFALINKKTMERIFFLELKMGNNLNEKKVLDDFYKLKRSVLIKDPNAIYIAIGYDPLNKKIFWKPTSEKFNYSFNLSNNKIDYKKPNTNSPPTIKEVSRILKKTPQEMYKNFVNANEAFWSCELLHQIKKILPLNWHVHSEITGVFENRRDSLDLGIYHENNLTYAIEIKGHWEKGISPELRNNMKNDKNMEADFFSKSNMFFKKYDNDSKILNSYKEYPKFNGNSFITPDFFGKIVEMYKQCRRMANLIQEGKIKKGFMVFGDHNDAFKASKKFNQITEEYFINNFNYRKELILKLLSPYMGDCEFIYYYGINSKNYTKKDVTLIE